MSAIVDVDFVGFFCHLKYQDDSPLKTMFYNIVIGPEIGK